MKKIVIVTAAIISLPLLSAEAPPMAASFNPLENVTIINPQTVSYLRLRHERLIQTIQRDVNKVTEDREKISLGEALARIQAVQKAQVLLTSLNDALNAKYGGTLEHPVFPADLLASLLSEEDIARIKEEELRFNQAEELRFNQAEELFAQIRNTDLNSL